MKTINPTDEQIAAVNIIKNWYEKGSKYFSLQGPAGSGKTTILRYLIGTLGCKTIATATTNASVKVLENSLGDDDIVCATVHRYLRLKVINTPEGSAVKTDEDKEPITNYDLAIVDECSMVGLDLWEKILSHPSETKWLFVGDPCQLPPVGCNISPTFSEVKDSLALKTIHRQSTDSPVYSLVSKVRESILDGTYQIINPEFDVEVSGAVLTVTKKTDWIKQVADKFCISSCPDRVRILTYTNGDEFALNTIIRRAVMDGAVENEFLPGEPIFIKSPIMDDDKVVLNANSRLRVIASEMKKFLCKKYYFSLPEGEFNYNHVLCETEYGEKIKIKVLSISSMADFGKYIKNRNIPWKTLNDLKAEFTDISHRYATTVRRAQGWNLKFVAFSLSELTKCRKITDKAHNYYSALTRTSDTVLILV